MNNMKDEEAGNEINGDHNPVAEEDTKGCFDKVITVTDRWLGAGGYDAYDQDDPESGAIQEGWVGKIEEFFVMPNGFFQRFIAPSASGVTGEALVKASGETLRAWPAIARSDITDITETAATSVFRLAYTGLTLADNYYHQPRILHIPKKILDAAVPGAVFTKLGLNLVGFIVRYRLEGNKTHAEVDVSNGAGAGVILAVATGGAMVWTFHTGAIGQLSKKYPKAKPYLDSGKFVTFGLRNSLILIGISTLVVNGLAQIFSSIPQEPNHRIELMEHVNSAIWAASALLGYIAAWFEAFGFRDMHFRRLLRPLFLSIIAPAIFITSAITNCYGSGEPTEKTDWWGCIFNMISLGLALSPAMVGFTAKALQKVFEIITPLITRYLLCLSINRDYIDFDHPEKSMADVGREPTYPIGYSTDEDYRSDKEVQFEADFVRRHAKFSHASNPSILFCCCPTEEERPLIVHGSDSGEDDLYSEPDVNSSPQYGGNSGYYG
jgi:hypothetical protein